MTLKEEELLTILCECEAIMNQRPITYVSEDPQNFEAFTPSMFLHKIKETCVSDLDVIDSSNLQRRYRYRIKLREELRRRFRSEYLDIMATKNKRFPPSQVNELKVGDLVLIGNYVSKRLEWSLARVEELILGKDYCLSCATENIKRKQHIKTSSKTISFRGT